MGDRHLVICNWRDRRHPRAGGAELACERVATHLAKGGWQVTVLAAAVVGEPAVEERDGYVVRRAGGTYSVYVHALLWLLRHRRDVEAVIDSQNGIPFFSPLVLPRTTPVLLLLHHVHREQFALYFPRPAAALGRWLESTASRWVYRDRSIIAVSPSTRRDARRKLGLAGDVVVVAPGSEQAGSASRSRTAHPSIVCVGRLVPHKHYDDVISAVVALRVVRPDLRTTLIGSGPDVDRLRALVAELDADDRVEVRSGVGDAERDALLSSAWLSVNASQGEGWGLSVIEANALGVPVVARRRPGLRDSIRDGETGWLLPDDTSLAEGIDQALSLLGNPHHATTVSQAARAWAARFTWPEMAAQIGDLLATEEVRLSRRAPERRSRSDSASVVTVPLSQAPADLAARLRVGDRLVDDGDHFTLLLRAADTAAAHGVLRRLGLPSPARTGADESTVRVARTRDHLHPSVAAPVDGGR